MRSKKKRTTRNSFETRILEALSEKLGKDGVSYERKRIKYTTDHVYIPDFELTESGILIETKGNGRSWSPQVRKKMLAVRDQHPELDIRFVFYKDGEFGPVRVDGTKMTQGEWCVKHGFKYAIQNVPDEWVTTMTK